MIEWKFEKENTADQKIGLNHVLDILEMKSHVSYEMIKHDEDINSANIEDFQKQWNIWLERWEDVEVFKIDPFKFSPIAMALVRRTFPQLFANKVVGVQAMTKPVGLAYALRVIYNEDDHDTLGGPV